MNPTDRLAVVASALNVELKQTPMAAKAAGVAGLLFDVTTMPALSGSGRREFRRLVGSTNRQIVGFELDLGAAGLSLKADVDRQLSTIEQAMELAAGLATPLVCVELGSLPAAAVTSPPKPPATQAMAGLLILSTSADLKPARVEPAPTPADQAFSTHLSPVMLDLARRADRFGVVLAFRSTLSSLASLEQAIMPLGCPWFGVDLDPIAALRDGREIDDVFSRVGGLIRHVRVRDAIVGTGGRTKPMPVGQGQVDWPAVLGNLSAAGYQGWITIDPMELADRQSAVRQAVAYLHSV